MKDSHGQEENGVTAAVETSNATVVTTKDAHEQTEVGDAIKSQITIVNSRTAVLLQTASGIISDTAEKRSSHIKILFDTGSQRTYISERIVKKLKLQAYSSREMTVRAFGDVEGKTSIFNLYRFCVRNPKREGMYK